MTLQYETPGFEEPIRYWLPPALFLACVLAGMLFGAATNSLSALVSPLYFQAIMGWSGTTAEIQALSIMQGIVEGGAFGVAFGAVYAIAMVLITHARCRFEFLFRHLLLALLIAASLWIVGGICGMTLALTNPNYPRLAFFGLDRVGTIRVAWVAVRSGAPTPPERSHASSLHIHFTGVGNAAALCELTGCGERRSSRNQSDTAKSRSLR